ncbi:MAG: hypothetical protein HY075_04800 [Deltaproteobacteria bacterium]|nr:hypothetical protein [Deltaproteobacteria bacterium]
MGSRRARGDLELKALRQLLQQQTDPVARAEIERFITVRSTNLAASPGAERLIDRFVGVLGAREVLSRKDVGARPVVYCVTNGSNILQIGQGTAKRFKGLFGGLPCPKHTKAFVVAASSVLHGPRLRFFALELDDAPERRRLEGELQFHFGETFIEGFGRQTTLNEVSTYLWDELQRVRCDALSHDLRVAMELVVQDGDVLHTLFRIPRFREPLQRLFDGYYSAVPPRFK